MRVWSLLRNLSNSVTGSLIATGIVAGIVAGWSAVKWPWYVALGVFVVAFVFVLFAINQITAHIERVRRARRNSASSAEIKVQIQDWLLQMRYSIRDTPEAKFNFVFSCRDFQETPFYVFQNETAPSTVSIMTWIEITLDDHRGFLNRTPELLSSIRMEMARLGVAYSGIAPPVTKLSARVDLPWGEYFTAYILQQAILYVFRARLIMAEMILVAFTRAGVKVEVPPQPQLPKADAQSKSAEQAKDRDGAG